jgi:uncharacterized protein with NAD-binding domain and iron-sulfur cluster
MAAAVDSLAQFVFDRTEAAGCRRGQVLAVSISAADALLERRPEDLVHDVHAALCGLFPATERADVVDAVVTKERAATFRAVPGARAHRAPASTRVPGVFVAGAWTATGWPATMESAVRSGHAAAHGVLEQTSVPSPEEMFA